MAQGLVWEQLLWWTGLCSCILGECAFSAPDPEFLTAAAVL